MKIFESHCHINDKSYNKDLDKVIERANSNGVSHMMIAGVTLETCKKPLKLQNSIKIFLFPLEFIPMTPQNAAMKQ